MLVAASKIGFYGWGIGIRAWDLTCFSGHAVLATGFWPVAMAVLVPPHRRRWRAAGIGLGFGLGLLVGISRIAVGAHPPSEVVAGLLLGGAGAGASLRGLARSRLPAGSGSLVLVGVAGLTLLVGSRLAPRLPSERWFADAGAMLSGHAGPYRRKAWHQGRAPAPREALPPRPGAREHDR